MISIKKMIIYYTTKHLFYLILLSDLIAASIDQQTSSNLILDNGLAIDPLNIYAIDGETPLLAASQLEVQHQNSPGHYEFEVAPKLEPPIVRKPPYKQSQQRCSGTDPLASFSPRDTLCGDLNQGRLPLNPLGQSIGDQSYPFELIKNKTLQFLARALPILKEEYETIPKVARYLPANYVLNPTHRASSLSHEQMSQINQHFADANSLSNIYMSTGLEDSSSLEDGDSFIQPTTFMINSPLLNKRRRRKRSTIISGQQQQHKQHQQAQMNGKGSVSVAIDQAQQQVSSLTVAELSPNATLVVSSAHSSHPSGRIIQLAPRVNYHSNLAEPNRELLKVSWPSGRIQQQHSRVNITNNNNNNNKSNGATHQESEQNGPELGKLLVVSNQNQGQSKIVIGSSEEETNNGPHTQRATKGDSKREQVNGTNYTLLYRPDDDKRDMHTVSTSASISATINHHEDQKHHERQKLRYNTGTDGKIIEANNSNQPHLNYQVSNSNSNNNNNHAKITNNNSQEQHQIQARSNSNGSKGNTSVKSEASHSESSQNSDETTTSSSQKQPKLVDKRKGNQQQQQQQQQQQAQPCSDSSNGFSLAICQAANALIEGSRQPAWIQIVKQLGSIYSGSDASLWSSLGLGQGTEQKSANGGSSKSSSTGSSGSSLTSLLSPLNLLFNGGYSETSRSDSSSSSKKDQAQQQSLSAALGTTMARVALAGWASNVLTGLVDYFAPNWINSFGRSGFAKRKKMNDPREQFVDTPASLRLQQPGGAGNSITQNNKQPPTPCPSVEEYISPTFARNYQGAWKYVVQIPHEGYFTQTIQRTSCVRQKCEFTEGICHESPRWVSLLVAEIYYPNAIFGRTGHPTVGSPIQANSNLDPTISSSAQLIASQFSPTQLNNLGPNLQQQTQNNNNNNNMKAQQRQLNTNNLQSQTLQNNLNRPKTVQDLLQVDSLNTYDHSLSSAYLNAANELASSWQDQAALQLAYNNQQLQQRNGLAVQGNRQQQQQQQQPQYNEARISRSDQVPQVFQQQQQQPITNIGQTTSQNNNNNNNWQLQQQSLATQEYIIALAAAALQQNPNMNINELIQSLQLPLNIKQQLERKRRDLNSDQLRTNQHFNGQQTNNYNINNLNSNGVINSNNVNTYQSQRSSFLQKSGQQIETVPSMNDITNQLASTAQSSMPPTATSNAIHQIQNSLQFDPITQAPSLSVSASLQPPIGNSNQLDTNQPKIPLQGAQTSMDIHSSTNHMTNSGSIQAQPSLSQQQQQQQQAQSQSQQQQQQQQQQVDCDGHDKIGCYVVRVYYDWFLVNGSCKCWKTNPSANSGQSGSSTSSTNSFLRRIFTG